MKHFGIFNTSGEVETAISQSAITEPYVVMVSGDVFYNSVGAETGMTGCWIEDSQGNIYSGIPVNNAYSFEYDKPIEETWTLYADGHVVTASSYYMELHEDCEGQWQTVDVVEDNGYPVENIDMGTQSDSDESYVHIGMSYSSGDSRVEGAITVFYCNPDPCAEYEEGTEEKCTCEGKYWYGEDCHDEPEPEPSESDPCSDYEEGSQEKCECEGRYWWNDECHDEPEASE
jgi:hypothetical protein